MKVVSLKEIGKKYLIQRGKEPTFKGAVMDLVRGREAFVAFPALHNISFDVKAGETVGIIGENGSGKSTLLGIIAGIVKPSFGELEVRGSIATLLELGAGFHGDLSGRENIFLNGSILGFSRKEMEDRFQEIVQFAELEKFIDMPVKYYSSGMYVRLGFSIAVSVEPDILLIDEVLAVGDEHFQKKCLRRIEGFQKKGKTLIFVSHALDLVEELCDKVILLEKGIIKMMDKPRRVLRIYRRMVEERDELLKPREWGTKEAVITGVRLMNSGGKETKEFLTGEELVVEISYSAPAMIDRPVFGISIHGQDGKNFFGTNTRLCNCEIPRVEGDGKIELTIEKLSLFKGDFFINFSLHSWDHEIQYHRLDFMHQIEVDNPRKEDGFLKLPCAWKLKEK